MTHRSPRRRPTHRVCRRAAIERLESRNLMSALPLGATSEDTGEFFLGRVAVVPVLFESNGSRDQNTEDWTPAKIDQALAKVREGVQWWSDALDALGTVHKLEFVIDETFARDPFPTPYEPISRSSQSTSLYISPFLNAQGITEANTLEDAVREFNNAERDKLGTDWAFTIFLINSSNDADGEFAPGEFKTAFAFAGGLYVVSPSTRPASTIAHETGHIFWAKDEYPGGASYYDRRGYYDTQNLNSAEGNPNPRFIQEDSIMSAGAVLSASFLTHKLPASTRAQLGWLDSDGDGIFDLADVPLDLEGDGRYDSGTGVFTFDGSARAVPLRNRNSSGPQNDITLNRIDRIEYRVDSGPWLTAQTIDAQFADVSFQLQLNPFGSIEFRAIDDAIGVTSPVLRTTGTAPLLANAAIAGFAFVDSSGEGENDPQESLLARATATITHANGSPVFNGKIEPDDFAEGPLPTRIAGVKLTAGGSSSNSRVGSFIAAASTGTAAFHYFNPQASLWKSDWGPDRQLVAEFDEPVGSVELAATGTVSFAGAASISYGRLEAYDKDGNLLARFTSDGLHVGESVTMRVKDVQGRIASIVASGHQFTSVGLDALSFGTPSTVVTGSDGVFKFAGLPDGDYTLHIDPEKLIYQYARSGSTITVSGGLAAPILAAFERVASPWLNLNDRYDVDGNGKAQPVDALRIINEISRRGTRILTNPALISYFFDANDDGAISPVDALRVINEIARRNRNGGDGESELVAADIVFAVWNPDLEKNKLASESQLSPLFGEQFG